MSWRKGIEKDLDEVVQIDTVFTNVSKGEAAKKSDLLKYFNTSDTREVCKIILREGELQVSPKERELMYESMFKDIVTIITNKCINPDTQRPYPGGVIERALKEQIHFSVKPSKSTKQQALEAIRKLKKKIPIERAHMRLKCTVSGKENVRKLRQLFKNSNKEEEQVKIEKDDYDQDSETANIVCLVDPGLYRDIFDLIQDDGEVQVLDTAVSEEGDTTIDEIEEAEVENKADHQEESTEPVEEQDDEEENLSSKKSKKKEAAVESDSKQKKSKKEKKTKATAEEVASDEEETTTKKIKKKSKAQKEESDEEFEETSKSSKNVTNHIESDEENEDSSVKRSNKKDKKKSKKNKQQKNNSDDEQPSKKGDEEALSDNAEEVHSQPKKPSKKELKKAKKNKQTLTEEEGQESSDEDEQAPVAKTKSHQPQSSTNNIEENEIEENIEIPKTKPTRKERKKKGNKKNVESDDE
ncbi:hypothetical protein FDP41_011919 [Naegleria fowleri]|uniref:Uncharacterized protein n=1 Tax=Naegleria fowleri TaxID=5763 RepID=A0A6A5C8I3_NAEFO|nr:uncharacterized protein FDP41_011919 [Naegleria fowleri]KAF0982058.1 hypothetical protein FDP41_011919 [Naegleria fowleri]